MVDYGIYYAYWTRDWAVSPVEIRECIDRAGDIGFDVVGLRAESLLDFDDDDLRDIRGHADARNVDLSFAAALTANADVSSADPETRRRGVELLERVIELVDEVDGRVLGGSMYAPWTPSFEGDPEEKAARMEQSIETWAEVAEIAEEYDVLCTLEVLNRFETFMLTTAEEAVEFVDRVDSPNVQLMLDTFHMNIEEDSMPGAIRTAGNHLGHFHVGENNRKPPGSDGNMPWREIADALDDVNYDGPVAMEPFVVPGGTVGSDIGVWRDLSEGMDLDVAAEESLSFLRDVFGN